MVLYFYWINAISIVATHNFSQRISRRSVLLLSPQTPFFLCQGQKLWKYAARSSQKAEWMRTPAAHAQRRLHFSMRRSLSTAEHSAAQRYAQLGSLIDGVGEKARRESKNTEPSQRPMLSDERAVNRILKRSQPASNSLRAASLLTAFTVLRQHRNKATGINWCALAQKGSLWPAQMAIGGFKGGCQPQIPVIYPLQYVFLVLHFISGMMLPYQGSTSEAL